MKLQQMLDRVYFLIIPKKIVQLKGWTKGQQIKIKQNKKGDLVLVDEKN